VIYVLYHAHCTDGFGAAFAAWKKFGDNAKYYAVSYGKPIPKLNKPKMVYILDFSYDKQTLMDLKKETDVVVLDHHKTAEKDLQGVGFAQFDMNRSGAMMAWEYFHPEKEIPMMIRYIQDRDLWKFDLKLTKEFHLGISMLPQMFEVWDVANVDDITRSGGAILSYQNMLIERIISSCVFEQNVSSLYGVELDESYNIAMVNSGVLESEIGDVLLNRFTGADFALVWYKTKDKKIKVSLRSRNERADVSEIAKKFNGGGHRNASGFIHEYD
jgi:nanoRNase/pAp phosphatase (c-di-AMP/oligoRNAs hydrolase)